MNAMIVIQFLEDWKADDGTLFLHGQEYLSTGKSRMPYLKKCGCNQTVEQSVEHYHFLHNNLYYHVPWMFAAPTKGELPQADNRTRIQKEIEFQTTDAYEKDGRFDMVGATKDFFGIDISAKPVGDQTDYELPAHIIRRLREGIAPIQKGTEPIAGGNIGTNEPCPVKETQEQPEKLGGDYNDDFQRP